MFRTDLCLVCIGQFCCSFDANNPIFVIDFGWSTNHLDLKGLFEQAG